MTTSRGQKILYAEASGDFEDGLAINKILTNTNRIVTAGCTPKSMFNIK